MSATETIWYRDEAALRADKDFMSWIAELEAIPLTSVGYTLPLSESTGLTTWHEAYSDGLTAEEAIKSDASYWENDE